MSHLSDITLDDAALPEPTPEIAQERKVAIFDLLEKNKFALIDGPDGPYHLRLGQENRRLVFDIQSLDQQTIKQFHLSLSPLRQVMRDYFDILDSYFQAVQTLPPAQIEAIDMGRRGIHNEGAELLRERLNGKVNIDKLTARRLFTLVCSLQDRGGRG